MGNNTNFHLLPIINTFKNFVHLCENKFGNQVKQNVTYAQAAATTSRTDKGESDLLNKLVDKIDSLISILQPLVATLAQIIPALLNNKK